MFLPLVSIEVKLYIRGCWRCEIRIPRVFLPNLCGTLIYLVNNIKFIKCGEVSLHATPVGWLHGKTRLRSWV